jgi:septum formation protein
MPALPQLVLASTSSYRRELLERLQLPFITARPDADETPLPGETPIQTALRLADAKARAVAPRFPDALIIGSDQVACRGNQRFNKPGSRDRAIAQLRELSGRSVVFHTGVCLLNASTGAAQSENVPVEVRFRPLCDDDIERYLERESALDCAGSARCEGLGIALLEHLRGDDPTALIGLPLIALCKMLRREGIALP